MSLRAMESPGRVRPVPVRSLWPSRPPTHSAAERVSRRAGGGSAVRAPAPRTLVAQLAAVVSSSPVVQCVGRGRYRLNGDGNLRGADKVVLAHLKAGDEVTVAPGAPTSTFDLGIFSPKKAHTWCQAAGHEGWVRDELLVRLPDPIPVPVLAPRPVPRAVPMSIGGGEGTEPAATTTHDELKADRRDPQPLSWPGHTPGAKPLGIGGKADRKKPEQFLITPAPGALHDSLGHPLDTGGQLATFVLSSNGRLYGGPDRDNPHEIMEKHPQIPDIAPAWAGMLNVRGGRVVAINNQSGAHMLSSEANVNVIKFLYRHRVIRFADLQNIRVERIVKPGLDRDAVMAPHDVIR